MKKVGKRKQTSLPVRFEVSVAVTMKNESSGMLRRVALVTADISEEHIASIISVGRFSVLQLLVTANVSSSLILFTLMMEALRSSETSLLTTATRCHVPEDGSCQTR
jgi:hypothetical protein